MMKYSYMVVRVESAEVQDFHRYVTEHNGEIIKMLSGSYGAQMNPDDTGLHDVEKEKVLMLTDENSIIGQDKSIQEYAFLDSVICQVVDKQYENEQFLFYKKREDDLSKLLRSIAHHWRQPLNVIGLYIQEICEIYREKALTDGYMEEFRKNSLDSVQNMSHIIECFKSSYKNLGLEIDKNIIHHIFDLLKLYKPELSFNNIDLRLTCSCKNRRIDCDCFKNYPPCDNEFVYSQLDIVKFNLVFDSVFDNAKYAVVKALENKYIEKGNIGISIVVSKHLMTIKIKNNGEHIDESIRDRIFMPYFTTKDVGDGTGLGLYIAKTTLAEFFNGRIEFQNCPDGVEFTIIINK